MSDNTDAAVQPDQERLRREASEQLDQERLRREASEQLDQERLRREASDVFQSAADSIAADLSKTLVISLVGNVNAGKSRTINALLGRDFASVAPIAGHTKHVQLYPLIPNVYISDTPGLEDVNAEVSKRALDFVAENTDIVLFFVNAAQGVTASEKAAFSAYMQSGIAVLVVVNKIDVLEPAEVPVLVGDVKAKLGVSDDLVVPVSAKTGDGIDDLAGRVFDIVSSSGKQMLFAKAVRGKDVLADRIISKAAAGAFAIGAIPIPGSDTIPLTAVQVGLLLKLAALYDCKITKDDVPVLIAQMGAGAVGRSVFTTLLKTVVWVVGPAGPVVVAGVAGVVAGSLTYGIGMAGQAYFKSGMSIDSSDLEEVYRDGASRYREYHA